MMWGTKHDDQRLRPLNPEQMHRHDPSKARLGRDGYEVVSAASYSDEGFGSYQNAGADLPRARDYPDPSSHEDC
jgi:hypothetical protein